jgi:aspartate/methionine/tyrosine aminotransferase
MPPAISLDDLSPAARTSPNSGIVDVVNYGRLNPDVIPLWVGEGDLPTPGFIIEAANRSLAAGETNYTWQRGIPDLRAAIATQMSFLYGQSFSSERFFVTGSGMQSLQIGLRLITGPGDEVIVPTPAWPNFDGAIGINGGITVTVPMDFAASGWTLDLARLEAAITPRTKAICINSPANPTGWTATENELRHILAMARRHGIWIIADEIYGRFVYDGAQRAPSFHDVREEDDRILFVQTFSKNYAMTGWRLGWIEAPPVFGQAIENLIQYSTSGSPVFIQRAAIAAIEQGEDFVRFQIDKAKRNRETLVRRLGATNKARLAAPAGAFYLFFALEGVKDARAAALQLIDEAGVGLAPGTAFGPGGEDFFRICYARSMAHIEDATQRLVDWLARQ